MSCLFLVVKNYFSVCFKATFSWPTPSNKSETYVQQYCSGILQGDITSSLCRKISPTAFSNANLSCILDIQVLPDPLWLIIFLSILLLKCVHSLVNNLGNSFKLHTKLRIPETRYFANPESYLLCLWYCDFTCDI